MATTEPGDNWDPKAHSTITGPSIGTVKANSEAIKALATWLKDTLTDPNGLFVLSKAWLTDCSGTGYPGAALRYDLYASRSGDPGSMAGPDSTAVGVLVGYPPYLKSAGELKKAVDTQLGALYLKFVEDGTKTDMSSGNLYTMVTKIAEQLNAVAADYDKGDEAIEKDLGDLANNIDSTIQNLLNHGGGNGSNGGGK
ncbi:hypothetical protein [Catenulispora subtropica]|uniref:Uncharacterized protein n=1 Tax=Catenulispora subtropica TaxID=450798 RepID=A0ABN2SZK3_9ACTN